MRWLSLTFCCPSATSYYPKRPRAKPRRPDPRKRTGAPRRATAATGRPGGRHGPVEPAPARHALRPPDAWEARGAAVSADVEQELMRRKSRAMTRPIRKPLRIAYHAFLHQRRLLCVTPS
jgi:hypothetical protein